MTIQSKSRRRAAVFALVALITIACGSLLRTAIDRELIPQTTVLRVCAALSPIPANREFYRLRAEDTLFREEARALLAGSGPSDRSEVVKRIRSRLDSLLGQYDAFLKEHPEHVQGLLAHGELLFENGDKAGGLARWEQAAARSPENGPLWSRLGRECLRLGEIKKAFECYERAVALEPKELGNYRDLSTAMFVYRRDAMEHYQIDEPAVFDRSLKLMRRAMELQPKNVDLAVELAMCYYSVKPARNQEAVIAWAYVRNLVKSDFERQAADLHMARFLIRDGHYHEAESLLAGVTHPEHALHKGRVSGTLANATAATRGFEVEPANFKAD